MPTSLINKGTSSTWIRSFCTGVFKKYSVIPSLSSCHKIVANKLTNDSRVIFPPSCHHSPLALMTKSISATCSGCHFSRGGMERPWRVLAVDFRYWSRASTLLRLCVKICPLFTAFMLSVITPAPNINQSLQYPALLFILVSGMIK